MQRDFEVYKIGRQAQIDGYKADRQIFDYAAVAVNTLAEFSEGQGKLQAYQLEIIQKLQTKIPLAQDEIIKINRLVEEYENTQHKSENTLIILKALRMHLNKTGEVIEQFGSEALKRSLEGINTDLTDLTRQGLVSVVPPPVPFWKVLPNFFKRFNRSTPYDID